MNFDDPIIRMKYPHLARATQRKVKQGGTRNEHAAHAITTRTEDRSWVAGDRCTDEQVEIVLMLLEDYGAQTQYDIALQVSELLGLNIGTARGATSGALFLLQEWEIAHWTGEYDVLPVQEGIRKRPTRSKVWEIINEEQE